VVVRLLQRRTDNDRRGCGRRNDGRRYRRRRRRDRRVDVGGRGWTATAA